MFRLGEPIFFLGGGGPFFLDSTRLREMHRSCQRMRMQCTPPLTERRAEISLQFSIMADNSETYDREELVKLLSDDEYRLTSELGHTLYETIDNFIEKVRPETIKRLEEFAQAVEKSYDKSRKARIAGTSAAISGSVLAIVGFGLSFVTFGGSLGLAIAGATLAAAGGVTLGGAEVGYIVISQKKVRETQKVCCDDNNEMKKIETQGREFSDHLDALTNKHPFSKEHIFHLLKSTWKAGEPALNVFYSGYKFIDGVSDVGRNVFKVTNTVRVGVQAGARGVYLGLGTVGRIFSIGSIALDVLFIPIDFAVLVKSAYDVHKYKNGKGKSSSSAASNIRKMLEELKQNSDELKEVRAELPGAENSKE